MSLASNNSPKDFEPLPGLLTTLDSAFIDGVQASLIVIDREYRVLLTNKFTQDWIKRKPEEMRGQHCFWLFHGGDEVCADCPSAKTFQTGETAHAIHTGLDKDGGITYAELTTHPIKNDRGEVAHVIEYVRDISEQMRFEQEILDSNRRLSALNDIAGFISGSLDIDEILRHSLAKMIEVTQADGGGILLLNSTGDALVLRSHLGMSAKFVQSPRIARITLKESFAYTVATTGKPVVLRNYADNPNTPAAAKREGIQSFASIPLRSRDKVVGVMNIIRFENTEFTPKDIDLLVAAGNQIGVAVENVSLLHSLMESEKKYRTVVENSNDLIWTLDCSGNFVWFNQRAEEVSGYELKDWVGKSFAPLVVPEYMTRVQQVHSETVAGHSQNYEVGVYKKNGDIYILSVNTTPILSGGKVIGTVNFGVDITERKRMEAALWESEEQLRRAQRLEMAGKVAGQVAHDFNNLLGPLVGYPELIKLELPNDHPVTKFCDAMLNAALQMAEINEDLLTLSRRGHFNQAPIQLNRILEQAIANISPKPNTLRIELDLADDLLSVQGSAAQLLRVVTNLISNSLEAMQNVGTLKVETQNLYVDEPTSLSGGMDVGEYVGLSIGDTGPGIPSEIKEKIFEPFFTTKVTNAKHGSGLGLSVVQVILDDHHGHVDVSSEEGKGTTFNVYFPACREEPLMRPDAETPLGTETILIVDDDEIQRGVVRQLLERLGYSVHAVETGEKAIAYLEQQAVDLMLLDMVMPGGIDGTETYRSALKVRPRQSAVIMSGYAEGERVREAQELGAGTFLRKPVTLDKLARAVRDELDLRKY